MMFLMREIQVVFYREGQHWVAKALDVGVSSFGDSLENARSAVREALELYFEDGPDDGQIEVRDARVETVAVLV